MSEAIVIVRTHHFQGHVIDLARSLNVPSEYRVVLAVDESENELDTGSYDKISLTRERFAEMGLLTDVDDIFWRSGDYAFYCAQAQYPEADRFWLIEHDVAINREDPISFFREIDVVSDHDFLSCHYREPEQWWFWADHLRGVYPELKRCFYPLVRLSSSAVRHAFTERVKLSATHKAIPKRDRNPWPNDEVFTASVLYNHGFNCADFSELGDFYTSDTFWGTPTRHSRILPSKDGLLYHPVRDGVNFLKELERGATIEPPVDIKKLIEIYNSSDAEEMHRLKALLLSFSHKGTPDDPGRILGVGSPVRQMIEASPTASTIQLVVDSFVSLRKALCIQWLCRNRSFEGWPYIADLDNLALGRPADQSSVSQWSAGADCRGDAQGGNNGVVDVDFGFHTAFEEEAYWTVDLGHEVALTGLRIFNRKMHWERLSNFDVLVSKDAGDWHIAHRSKPGDVRPTDEAIRVRLTGHSRYLRIRTHNTALHLREVQVLGYLL